MSSQSRFNDPGYLNWIKDSLALYYLKEGIELVVNAEANAFHDGLRKNLGENSDTAGRSCLSCTAENVVRKKTWQMECQQCEPWLKQILQQHVNPGSPNITWKNSNPRQWPTHPWEVLKCYMGFGCQNIKSAQDADFQAVLTMMKNCLHFSTGSRIKRYDLVEKLLKIRNTILHSGNNQVDEARLKDDVTTMLAFLSGLTSLSLDENRAVQDAVDKITELQSNSIELSFRDLEIRAIKQQQVAIEAAAKEAESLAIKAVIKANEADTTATEAKSLAEKAKKAVDAVAETASEAEKTATVAEATANIAEATATDAKITAAEAVAKAIVAETTAKTATTAASDTEKTATEAKTTATKAEKTATVAENKAIEAEKIAKEAVAAVQNAATVHDVKSLRTDLDASSDKIENLMQKLSVSQDKPASLEMLSQSKPGFEGGDAIESDITRLQSALVNHYEMVQSLLIQNPVTDEAHGLEEIYVRPDIKVLREKSNPRIGLRNVNDDDAHTGSGSICKNLFYTETETECYKNKQIYVTGKAGVGKSVLCKFLLKLWCDSTTDVHINTAEATPFDSEIQHHELSPDELRAQEDEKEMKENRRVISDFKLVFYITLRDSPNDYTIADMIDDQILDHITCTPKLKATNLLQNYHCLIILDGLDEWTCPANVQVPPSVNRGIPGRDLTSENVCLTTTRSWKLDVLKLKGNEIDKHVELCGLNETSAEEFCSKYIELLNNLDGTMMDAHTFVALLKENDLDTFFNLPNILTLLIGLWFDYQDLGQSRVQLFCSMLEMLLKKAVEKNLPEQNPSESKTTKDLLPGCFRDQIHCLTYQQLLRNLCQVAFEALLDPKRENALVFDSSQMELFGIDKYGIDLCLKSGILVQNKVLRSRSGTKKRISFLHKMLQEMLAAVYISNNDKPDHVVSRIKSFCTTVESVLELSQVWMFLSGLNVRPDLLMTDLLNDVLCKDITLQQYRQNPMFGETRLPEAIQNCVLDCVLEAKRNGNHELCLPLVNFVIQTSSQSTERIERLFKFNRQRVKSIYIHTTGILRAGRQPLARILDQLQSCLEPCLEALYLYDPGNVVTDKSPLCAILPNNKHTLTCVELYRISLSEELFQAVCSTIRNITVLTLHRVYMTHELRDELLLLASQASNIRQLDIWIHCTHTGTQCKPAMDLSKFPQLERLFLGHVKIDNLSALAPRVEGVYLQSVTTTEAQLRQFVCDISNSTHAVKVELVNTTVTGGSPKPVDLNDLKQNDALSVSHCHYDISEEKWTVHFSTQHSAR